jgi:hypothetical protein
MLDQTCSNTVALSDSNDILNIIIWKNICIRSIGFVTRALQMLYALQHNSNCMYHLRNILKLYILSTDCIHVFQYYSQAKQWLFP